MAVFNLGFVNKKTAPTTGDYSVLVDQLDIYQSQLSADGKLSPGDYKLLIQKAQQVYANPGLTPSNRAAIQVKMAGWQSDSTSSTLKTNNDISRINNNATDDGHSNSMYLGNNPKAYLGAQAAAQQNKISQLADAIDQMDASGQDSSSHVNEYNSAIQDYQDTLEALNVVETHVAGQAPSSDQVAYVTTNGTGEITNVSVGREGSQSGYLETNGLYGGLKIYGKLNKKDNGKNVFLLGSKTFSGTDVVVPGPDGTLKPSVLIDSAQQSGKQGVFTSAVAGYSDMDSATTRTQSAIPTGAYGKGKNGFLYKKNDDGSYTKYVNSDPVKLGIQDNEIISLPSSIESSIVPQVKDTIDSSVVQPTMPTPTTFNSAPAPGDMSVASPSNSNIAPASAFPAGHPGPSTPVTRSPQGFAGVAQNAISSAGSYLGKLFGGGK